MTEHVNCAAPDLATPGRFMAYAGSDLGRALPGGWQLFRARLSGQNRQSWLGWLWLFLPTAAMALTSIFIQQRALVAIAAPQMPYPAFVLTGLIAWQIFVDAVNAPLRQLEASKALLTHSDVPHETMLVAALLDTSLSGLIRLCIGLPIVALLWVPPGLSVLLVPVTLAALVLLGFAIGTLVAPLALLLSDVRHALTMLLTLGMFVTPVFYPIPPHGWLALNPVRPLVEAMRATMTGGTTPAGFVEVLAGTLGLLLVAWLFSRLARPFLAERLT